MSLNSFDNDWFEYFPSPVTFCDVQGIIVSMNKASREKFASKGGEKLIGTSLFDCHPEPANKKIRNLLQSEGTETYIVEGKRRKRLIHQTPWYKNGEFAGLIETIIDFSGNIEERKRS